MEHAALELDVLAALAAARTRPQDVAARLKARLKCYRGAQYAAPGRTPKQTKEGAAACKDALTFLARLEGPLEPVAAAPEGLRLAGVDHVLDVGVEGVASHRGTDDSSSTDRNGRYGAWGGATGECIWYGNLANGATGASIVDDLVVDDGVRSRGHRLCVYDARWTVAAVAAGAHATYANMVAVEFAATFENDDAGGGTVVELPDGRKWHEACFVCSRCGDSVAGKDKRKKDEGGYIFCAPCHVELYAPACVVCGAKIDGDRINMGDGAYHHPGCKKPPAKKKKAKRRVGPKALANLYAGLDEQPAAGDAPPAQLPRGSQRVLPTTS
ncbi:hypothetical protein JL722_9372 [Aureococcus anophagefferens]|nr:hypothetical protein JL722_9372 [Aureococcus anophagefferens]